MQRSISSAASNAVEIWASAVVLGALLTAVLSFLSPGGVHEISSALSSLGNLPETPSLAWIFLKNSIASMCIIFLGTILCVLELWIYRGVSQDTYAFLERLTDPLYSALDLFFREHRDLKPFFRSCHFYLNFVPVFAMLVNGLVLGFYMATELPAIGLLFPHGAIEIPAMLGSAALAFHIAEELREPIFSADSKLLLIRMQESIAEKRFLLAVLTVQLLLLIAAYLETL